MAGVTLTRIQARRQRLLDLLPEHDWSIIKAGIAAGYSKNYALTRLKGEVLKNKKFCEAILAKRQEIEAGNVDRREKRLHDLDMIIDAGNTPTRDRIKAMELQGKMLGWLSETRVLEVSTRQRELTQAEQLEARKLAILRFDTREQSISNPLLIDAKFSDGKDLEQQADTTSAEQVNPTSTVGDETGSKQGANPAQSSPGDGQNEAGRQGGEQAPYTPQGEPAAPFPCSPPDFSPSPQSGPVDSEIGVE